MPDFDWSDVLFIGWDDIEGVTFYRTYLPAKEIGAEYVVFDPFGHGVARSGTKMEHKVAVIQHCWQQWQLRIARKMRSLGMKTIINVDDWVPGIKNMEGSHAYHSIFAKKEVSDQYVQLLKEADGIIAATPWLVERCLKLNKNVQLARNGLDLARYAPHRRLVKDSESLVLGWAGGTGHTEAFLSIVPVIEQIMDEYDHVLMHVVGDDNHTFFHERFSDRVKHFPWADKYIYPRHLSTFDINLAPALSRDFYKAKSQLRLYEACAMGTPTIGHPMYSECWDAFGQLALLPDGPDEWIRDLNILIRDDERRADMASSALAYAERISIEVRAPEWKTALLNLTSP